MRSKCTQVSEFQKRTQIKSRFEWLGARREPQPEVSAAIFRVVQEALTNVLRHAAASEVVITVKSDGDMLSSRSQMTA
jgi:signal transduction histidine kinase